MTDTHSWREFWKVHPAAEVFPLLPPDELRKLADDINKNGLKVAIQTRAVAGETKPYVIDGRNRLDAMEKVLGWEIVDLKGNWIGALTPVGKNKVEHLAGYTDKQVAAEVIGLNIRRRHLSKQKQVELIAKVLRASGQHGEVLPKHEEKKELANMARSFSPTPGKRGGSTKDEHKAAVITQAARVGISKRTVERHFTNAKPRKPKPPVNRLTPEYIHKRFGMFIKHWPHEEWRKVHAWLKDYLKP